MSSNTLQLTRNQTIAAGVVGGVASLLLIKQFFGERIQNLMGNKITTVSDAPQREGEES